MATQLQAVAESENTRRDEDCGDESQETAFLRSGCCCFWKSNRKSENWERISASGTESPESRGRRSILGRGIDALKKVREWSELVAGPKWKTFIRRFNRTGARSKAAKFQYDPLSYALNFDDGKGQSGNFEEDRIPRDFSSRYAAIPVHNGQLN